MTASWMFRAHRRCDKVRDPIQGEFFSDEAVGDPGQALVRESIQNSLDARRRGHEEPVRVRFYVSGDSGSVPAAKAKTWFGEAWAHFKARRSGLQSISDRPSDCRFVVVEDFGTTGLTGDPRQGHLGDGRNRFFNFWRAEGVSEKSGSHGGRWGVGKTVFPRSSGTNTFFGLTVRENDPVPLLMGHCVLRHHLLAGEEFGPDGFFGLAEADGFVLPSSDPGLLADFRRAFHVAREQELGLSVVIPYAQDDITCPALALAVARDYFYPILAGALEVNVEDHGGARTRLAQDTLPSLLETELEWSADLRAAVDLARWVVEAGPKTVILASHGESSSPLWTAGSIPDAVRSDLRADYLAGKRIAVRVPVVVRATGGERLPSHFDVYLQRDLSGRGSKPVYVRNGIIIPDVRERRVYGHRLHALILCEDEAIAALLGDAETPAHTHWSKDAYNFRGKYEDGPAYLNFVAHAPRSLAELLAAVPGGRDKYSLAGYFPRVSEGGDAAVPGRRRKPGPTQLPPEAPLGRGAQFSIEPLKGGVTIAKGPALDTLPRRVRVELAYDRTRGNPLSKYHPADFRLEEMGGQMKVRKARVVRCIGNIIEVEPSDTAFRIELRGFDANRDLYVRARKVDGDG